MSLTKNIHHDPMARLKTDLAYWQRQLRLDDFDIKLRWLASDEDAEACGKMFPKELSHEAVIAVRHPSDVPPSREVFTNDHEVTLVHELLHVRDLGWARNRTVEDIMDNDEVIKTHFEIALDAVAEALVRARRGMTR